MSKEKPKKKENVVEEPISTYENEALDFEKVWKLFQETDKQFKETDKRFKETDKQFKENEKKFQESRKEIDRMSRETQKKLDQVSGMFSTQWGKLMEAIVAPSCLKLFKEREIDVARTYQNIEIKSKEFDAEFDVVLANGQEVVIVEVKTTMTVKKVNEFIEKLSKAKQYLPEHKDKQIYGAVAGIKYDENSDKYAYRQGLFVLINSGDSILKIANHKSFNPKAF